MFGRKTINLDEQLYSEISEQISETPENRAEIGVNYEKAKEHLFSLLHDGKLKAKGRWSDTYETRGPRHPNLEWPLYSWDIAKPNSQDIPADFWILRGIDFEYSSAKSPKGEYQNITVATDELFKAHPEEAPEPFPAEKRGDNIVSKINIPAPKRSRAGRPSLIRAELIAEMLRLKTARPNLFDKPADMVRHLRKFSVNWEKAPTESTIEDFVRDVFNASKRKS